jgi:hypothetical protein
MKQIAGRYKKAFDPIKLDKPGKTTPVPKKEKADLNILQRYKTLYNNSKEKGAAHLTEFYELFELSDYYTAVEDSSPILLKVDERRAFFKRTKKKASGTCTSHTYQDRIICYPS